MGLSQYGATYATSRCPKKDEVDPKSKAWIEGVVNTEEITARFASHEGSQEDFVRRSTSELVYRLFTHPLTYTEFATVAVDPKNSRVAGDLNLEYIHNNIHWWVGGEGGHMSEIPVATFDPIFWLHHW